MLNVFKEPKYILSLDFFLTINVTFTASYFLFQDVSTGFVKQNDDLNVSLRTLIMLERNSRENVNKIVPFAI